MTILITGAAGQDGTLLAHNLEDNQNVYALCRPSQIPKILAQTPWAHAIPIDLTNFPEVLNLLDRLQPSLIFNLAGFSSVRNSWDNKDLNFKVNYLLPKLFIDWIGERSPETTLIQASSSEIYAGGIVSPQTEITTARPNSPYGEAKLLAHNYLEHTREEHSLKLFSAIMYNHESPLRSADFVTRHISLGVAKILRGQSDSLTIGNMHSKRDWGWAPEYVEALISISRLENASTFILSTGQINTVADLVMHAFHSQGITAYEKFLKTDETRMRIVDAQALVGEASKAKAYFGWQSKTSVGEIMGKMVSWDLKVLDDPSVEFSLEWNH